MCVDWWFLLVEALLNVLHDSQMYYMTVNVTIQVDMVHGSVPSVTELHY